MCVGGTIPGAERAQNACLPNGMSQEERENGSG